MTGPSATEWIGDEVAALMRCEAEHVERLILEGHNEIARGPILGGHGLITIYSAPPWSQPRRRLKIEWARLGWRLGHRRRHG